MGQTMEAASPVLVAASSGIVAFELGVLDLHVDRGGTLTAPVRARPVLEMS